MRLYIAAHNQDEARKVAAILAAVGHTISATWLQEDFNATASYTEAERVAIAAKDIEEVRSSDAVISLAAPYRVPGGKFVEVGAAIALGLPVFVIGVRENMLMWHPLTSVFTSAEDLAKHLT